MKTLKITKDNQDQRIDKFLRKYFASLPLSTIFRFLRKKHIKVNGQKADQKYLLQEGDEITIYLSEESLKKIEKESLEKREKSTRRVKPSFGVLYEDDNILVVDKPGNIAVHSGTSVGFNNLINQVLTYLDYRHNGFKPAFAHRLDMQTSGAMIVGKSREALLDINAQIKRKKVEKKYLALIEGTLKNKHGTIRIRLKRQHRSEKKFKVKEADAQEGQEAVTHYKILKEWSDKFALVELVLETGRTHQIRAHLFTLEHPIVGDASYGNFALNKKMKSHTGLKRQFLHAYYLGFQHPVTRNKMQIESPLPKDLKEVISYLDATYHEQKDYS